jgi:hypothetical protein
MLAVVFVVFSVSLPSENAAAAAQGTAFAAQADDPAGMTHLRGRFPAGIEFLSVHTNRPGAPLQPGSLASGER